MFRRFLVALVSAAAATSSATMIADAVPEVDPSPEGKIIETSLAAHVISNTLRFSDGAVATLENGVQIRLDARQLALWDSLPHPVSPTLPASTTGSLQQASVVWGESNCGKNYVYASSTGNLWADIKTGFRITGPAAVDFKWKIIIKGPDSTTEPTWGTPLAHVHEWDSESVGYTSKRAGNLDVELDESSNLVILESGHVCYASHVRAQTYIFP